MCIYKAIEVHINIWSHNESNKLKKLIDIGDLHKSQTSTVFIPSLMLQCTFNFKVVSFAEERQMTTSTMMKDLSNI